MPPGSLVMLSDHINWSGVSPLAGPNDNSIGPRFVDLNRAYDPELRALLHESAREVSVALHDGIYIWCLGPNFETPAEIRAFRTLGADIVGGTPLGYAGRCDIGDYQLRRWDAGRTFPQRNTGGRRRSHSPPGALNRVVPIPIEHGGLKLTPQPH
jgi:hypothetical protein